MTRKQTIAASLAVFMTAALPVMAQAEEERLATPDELQTHCTENHFIRVYLGKGGSIDRPFELLQCDLSTVFGKSCEEIEIFLNVPRRHGREIASSVSAKILDTYEAIRPDLSRDYDSLCQTPMS